MSKLREYDVAMLLSLAAESFNSQRRVPEDERTGSFIRHVGAGEKSWMHERCIALHSAA